MKVHEIIRETTTAGSIATVAQPLGKMQRRKKDSIFASKKADADEQTLKDQVSNTMIRRNP
jgi:hypothetical protein